MPLDESLHEEFAASASLHRFASSLMLGQMAVPESR